MAHFSIITLFNGAGIPVFPGPDLICKACVPREPLRRYYRDEEVFHASHARAGHYSPPAGWRAGMYEALRDSLKKLI